jgi:hypothetical protein
MLVPLFRDGRHPVAMVVIARPAAIKFWTALSTVASGT